MLGKKIEETFIFMGEGVLEFPIAPLSTINFM
jgi:hypothetical protein